MYRSVNHKDLAVLKGRDPHFDMLWLQHDALEDKLAEEMAHPALNWDGVKLIKREKVRVLEALRARAGELQ